MIIRDAGEPGRIPARRTPQSEVSRGPPRTPILAQRLYEAIAEAVAAAPGLSEAA